MEKGTQPSSANTRYLFQLNDSIVSDNLVETRMKTCENAVGKYYSPGGNGKSRNIILRHMRITLGLDYFVRAHPEQGLAELLRETSCRPYKKQGKQLDHHFNQNQTFRYLALQNRRSSDSEYRKKFG
jgi:hypothetical protein